MIHGQQLEWTADEIGWAILNGGLAVSDLTVEQLVAWIEWEPPPVPLTSFDLGDERLRCEFLWEYYWQGEPTLFAAVAHVWDSLEGDRAGHGTLVGLVSGTGGVGKKGIRLTLQQFLRECLAGATLLPRREDYSCLEEWHHAVQQSFANDEDHARALCVRYSAILDGRFPDEGRPASAGPAGSKVIVGPWRSRS